MLSKLEVTLSGVSPLMLHNGHLADPTNTHTKALKSLTSKRNKTEEDLLNIRQVEWMGGLYLDASGRVAIPAEAVLATVIAGARKDKLGKQASAGVFEVQPFYPLKYDGPKDLNKLYADGRFADYRSVVVQRNRCMRCRPVFPQWDLPIQLSVNDEVINIADVKRALEVAGEVIGLCEYRPRFGRFVVNG